MSKFRKSFISDNLLLYCRFLGGTILILASLSKIFEFSSLLTLSFTELAFFTHFAKFFIISEFLIGLALINGYLVKYASILGFAFLGFSFFVSNKLIGSTGLILWLDINNSSIIGFLYKLILMMIFIGSFTSRKIVWKEKKIQLTASVLIILIFAISTFNPNIFGEVKYDEKPYANSISFTNDSIKLKEILTILVKSSVVINRQGKGMRLDSITNLESNKNYIHLSFFSPSQCYSCLVYLREIDKINKILNTEIKLIAYNTNWSEIKEFSNNFKINNYPNLYVFKESKLKEKFEGLLYDNSPNILKINSNNALIKNYIIPKDPFQINNFIKFLEENKISRKKLR